LSLRDSEKTAQGLKENTFFENPISDKELAFKIYNGILATQ
jgi:hypothetical protein